MSSLDLSKFTYIEGGCHLAEDRFTRNHMLKPEEIESFRHRYNNTGVYLTAYWYDTDNIPEANLYGHFYLDFDSEEDFEKARMDACDAVHYLTRPFFHNIPEHMIRIFFSGQKGIHIVVPAEVFGVEPSKNLNEYYRVMAEKIAENISYGTIDFKVYDRRRLFRIPNSIHHKTGLYKIPLSYQELIQLSFEEIQEKARTMQTPHWSKGYEITRARKFFEECIEGWTKRYSKQFSRDRKETKPLDFIPACIQELIDGGPVRGQRNNSAAALVSFWKRQGESQQEVWENLVEWNAGSLTERELRTVIDSVYKRDYEYGCKTLETLATCIGKDCPLWKGNTY